MSSASFPSNLFTSGTVAVTSLLTVLVSQQLFNTATMNWETEIPGWCNSSISKPYLMKMDQACFTLHHLNTEIMSDDVLEIWGQSTKCDKCPLWKFASVQAGLSSNLVVNTTYATYFEVKRNGVDPTVCSFMYHFGEFGLYSMNSSIIECQEVQIDHPPANIYLPFLWTALAVLFLLMMWGFKCIILERNRFCLWTRWFAHNEAGSNGEDEAATLIPSDSASTVVPDAVIRNRIRCLDTFRGITIVLMILVNYGGGGYWFLEHIPWNGLTVADVVFPCFVWLLGASCVLSVNSKLRHSFRKRKILCDILRRTGIMFTLGFLINTLSNNNIYTVRIPGVLQRLSFVYVVVALIELIGFDPEDNQRYAWFAPIRDLVCSWRQWSVVLSLVVTQLLVTFLTPVPGCPLGYLGPGGLEDGGKYRNCTGGAARLVDLTLFGNDHIYQRPTPRVIYDTNVSYDPEGFLGSFTCVLCAYLGAEAAKILLLFPSSNQRIVRWFIWSIVTGLIGGALCSFSINDGPIPINKNLWSLSFVLITSSIAFAILSVLYIFIDALAWWSGAPFRYAGMNAILLYIGHIFARPLLPFSWQPIPSTHAAHLSMNVIACASWILISWMLYRKRLFVKL